MTAPLLASWTLVARFGVRTAEDADFELYHEQVRQAVNDVLSSPEFKDLRAGRETWWFQFLNWLGSKLEGVGDNLRALPEWALWLLVGWMVLVLVAILVHMAYVLWGTVRRSGAARSDGAERQGRGELLGIRDLEFASVYDRARQLVESGDPVAATKYLYVAAILWLDLRGRIAFRASKTNYDYLGELTDYPEDQGRFRELTGRFETTAYGGEPPTARSCQEMVALVESLRREAASPITL